MPAIALTHLALHVSRLEDSVSFYERHCGLRCIHRRGAAADASGAVAWLAEPGRERDFVLVFISGAPPRTHDRADYSHLGFALHSRAAVDAMAQRARTEGCLAWEPHAEPFPVGYYCGLRDPDGNVVEFSFGQPRRRAARVTIARFGQHRDQPVGSASRPRISSAVRSGRSIGIRWPAGTVPTAARGIRPASVR
jgi:catechol 2,3-dioxygenase-like lactoylglutathione lyase family enzyme